MRTSPLPARSLPDTSRVALVNDVSPGTRRSMRSNRRTDTQPEIRLRSALHRSGRRFRKDVPVRADGRRVRVDIAFPRQRVAVFVDGCFWHCCPEHGSRPRTNEEFWRAKLDGNVHRDEVVNAELQRAGWHVLRIWEHESVEDAVSRVEELLVQTEQASLP